jgi:hypothetical protein
MVLLAKLAFCCIWVAAAISTCLLMLIFMPFIVIFERVQPTFD